MRVLVACEYSGIVRDAFLAKGHDAMSCDLLPTESEGPHYQGDVMDVLNDGWDLLIGHPPCTAISYAGTQSWNNPGRVFQRLDALHFFATLWEAPIPRICLENPKSCASPVIAKYSQEIQPFYFGDNAFKTTWLWLKNLPLLVHHSEQNLFSQRTAIDTPQHVKTYSNGKACHHTKALSGVKNRQKERARFWPGIAAAMADQWGCL
jgi:hypothetical protein